MTGLRGWGLVAVYRRFTEWQVPHRVMLCRCVTKLVPMIIGLSFLQLSCYLLRCYSRRALRKVARSKFSPCMEKRPISTTRSCRHCAMPKKLDTSVCEKFPKGQPRVLRSTLLTPGSAEIGSQFYYANILASATSTTTLWLAC
jgi:hypothetical protein